MQFRDNILGLILFIRTLNVFDENCFIWQFHTQLASISPNLDPPWTKEASLTAPKIWSRAKRASLQIALRAKQ